METEQREVFETDEDVCRICYTGRSHEELTSPCRCTGSLGYVHASCLEAWIERSGSPWCDICRTSYPSSVHYKWWRVFFTYLLRQQHRVVTIVSIATYLIRLFVVVAKLWKEVLILSALVLTTVLITALVLLSRNLMRYVLWRRDLHDAVFIDGTTAHRRRRVISPRTIQIRC